jgi:DNA-binding GntR family transcriptional regulator
MVIYGLASRLAIDRLSDREIRSLEKVSQEMKTCAEMEPPNIARYQSLNDTFHRITIDAADHERLKTIILNLNNQMHNKSLSDKEHLLSSWQYHSMILEAIKARDGELAEKLTRDHVLRGLELHQPKISKESPSL